MYIRWFLPMFFWTWYLSASQDTVLGHCLSIAGVLNWVFTLYYIQNIFHRPISVRRRRLRNYRPVVGPACVPYFLISSGNSGCKELKRNGPFLLITGPNNLSRLNNSRVVYKLKHKKWRTPRTKDGELRRTLNKAGHSRAVWKEPGVAHRRPPGRECRRNWEH